MKVLAPALLGLFLCVSAAAQTPDLAEGNSLKEVRDKRNALLSFFKSRGSDASDGERAIIDDVLHADPVPKGRYRWVYTQLARKLNKYIHKYNSLSPAHALSDADYV